jgi:hypothetical protein
LSKRYRNPAEFPLSTGPQGKSRTDRKDAQNICSHRPWKMRRKTTMLPIAPSKPTTTYNRATTSPPMNWLLDPAPASRFCSTLNPSLVLRLNRFAVEEADHRHRLLRPRRERPRHCRAAEQRDELASLHSMTSSARARSVGGTSRPSDLAVLRLITSSNVVGSSMGRSAGFAPLRILST